MAWTTPRTWTDGELVTAALMNTHVRDNLLMVGPHLIVRKPSDQSVTSSTTLQNDNNLLLTMTANEIWQFQFVILFTGDTGDIKIAFTFPSGGSISAQAVSDDAAGTIVCAQWTGTTSPTGSWNFQGDSASEVRCLPIQGVHVNGGTGGNLQLQWAQEVSDGTATVIKANSTLWAVKLA